MDSKIILARLNDALRRDWRGVSALIHTRVPVSPAINQPPLFQLFPINQNQVGLGPLGLINGLIRENDEGPTIEAVIEAGEIIAFAFAGQDEQVKDVRVLLPTELQQHQQYRVTDRAGTHWAGVFLGYKASDGQEGVHLQLTDGSIARIFFHDVAKVVPY